MSDTRLQSQYVSELNALISNGLSLVARDYLDAHTEHVMLLSNPDGGFPGRLGYSDLYYTDFALRTLKACGCNVGSLEKTAKYIGSKQHSLSSVVDCFNWLNSASILNETGFSLDIDSRYISSILENNLVGEGFYAKRQGGSISIYATFLAALCCQMLGDGACSLGVSKNLAESLQCAEGGFSETLSGTKSQTSATAAAISLLAMLDEFSQEKIKRGLAYIAAMQRMDGGMAASADIAQSDLLSTFSGLAVLALYGDLESVNLMGIAAFLGKTANKHGGYFACIGDTEADIEYTYYGVAVHGILRHYLQNRNNIT